MSNIVLSIIIVNYNTSVLLQKCLNSIRQTCNEINYEIIMVDNNSSDDFCKIMSNYKKLNIHLIRNNENKGFPVANNQALKFAKGDYILLLNPDTELTPKAVKNIINYLLNNPKVGIVGPKVLCYNGKLQNTPIFFPNFFDTFFGVFFLNRIFPKSKIFNRTCIYPYNYKKNKEVDMVSGCFLLFRKKVYDDIGGLDENLFFREDVDFCKMAKNKGWKVIYFPSSEIYHYGGGSSKRNRYFVVYFSRKSRILYFKKHHKTSTNIFITTLTFFEMLFRIPLEFIIYIITKNTKSKTRLKAYFDVIAFIYKGEN